MAGTEENLNECLVAPVKQIDKPLTTHETSKLPEQTESKLKPHESPPTLENQLSISFFDPNVISTPGKSNFKNTTISPGYQQSQLQSFDSVNDSPLQTQFSYSMNGCYSFNPLQDSAAGSTYNKLSLPYTQVLVALSPQAGTTTSPMLTTMISSIPLKMNYQVSDPLNRQIEIKSTQIKPGCRSKRSRLKNAAYKELEGLHSNAIEPQVKKKTI